MCKNSLKNFFFETEEKVTLSTSQIAQNKKIYEMEIRKIKIDTGVFIANSVLFIIITSIILAFFAGQSSITYKSGYITFLKYKYTYLIFIDELLIFFMALQILYKCDNKILYFCTGILAFINFVITIFFARNIRALVPNYTEVMVLVNFLLMSLCIVSPGIKKDLDALYIVAYILSVSFFSLGFITLYIYAK